MFIPSFPEAIAFAEEQIEKFGEWVDAGRWQGYHTEGKPDLVTKELTNLCLDVPVGKTPYADPDLLDQLRLQIKPNLPWADAEFEERVGGEPHNPHHSLGGWPWWHGGEQAVRSMIEGKEQFTHTYSERFWPAPRKGLRYRYGDLNDVVALLLMEPMTRQATFPIFFPEDTGAHHDGRTPCTLHYHFLLRGGRLDMWYPIRSCDMIRHFRDDLYMAVRLMLWVIEECQRKSVVIDDRPGKASYIADPWASVLPGMFHFTAYSFHYHKGDAHLLAS